jgi:hypothetical protein
MNFVLKKEPVEFFEEISCPIYANPRPRPLSCLPVPFFLLILLSFSEASLAEAPAISSVGLMTRTINYSLSGVGGAGGGASKAEVLADPLICERVSTPSALGFEVGAGGCAQLGGTYTFAQAVSMHGMLLYYPLASRASLNDEGALRMRHLSFSNFYIVVLGGFTKLTHQQILETNLTVSTDILDFGGGVGYSYRFFKYTAIGVEGYYLSGSIISNAVAGSTSAIFAGATVTFFL